MSITFPGESAEYRAARDRLLEQEISLRRVTEAVAAARRDLPPGGEVPEDYVFQGADGGSTDVRLSELFEPGKDSLAIYNFMFPRSPEEDLPCPSCTQFLDALDGAAGHIVQRVNLAVVAKARWRASSPTRRSAAGGTCGCCPLRATPTTAVISARLRRDTNSR